MPLVRIDLTSDRTVDQRRAVADAVHVALVETLGIPERDRFNVITVHDPADIIAEDAGLGFTRSAKVVMVHVFTQTGRSVQTKQRLFAAITAGLADVGVADTDVVIAISENRPEDWSFGRGAAQYVTGELAVPH